jgi:two-component system chemotaxis response regulator CheY
LRAPPSGDDSTAKRTSKAGVSQVSAFDFSHLTALLVEDSDFVRRIVKKYLEDFGFKAVHEASNGMDGIEQLKHNPDFIVCDVEMEPLNGMEFLKLLRKHPGPVSKVPVMFLTGSAEKETVDRALALGVSSYILKPVTPETLKKKIIDLMSKALSA